MLKLFARRDSNGLTNFVCVTIWKKHSKGSRRFFWPMMPFVGLEPAEFIRYRRDFGDIFSSEQIITIIDTMAKEYESDSSESDTSMDGWIIESISTASDDENFVSLSDVADSMMEESDSDSSPEDDSISESELTSIGI